MTFSIAGYCERTGQYGVCVSTYSMAVGSFVPIVVPNRGTAVLQACVNTDLRKPAAELLSSGASAAGILKYLGEKDDWWDLRQVCVVDSHGHSAAHTGPKARGWAGHKIGPGYVASGNVLVGQQVVEDTAKVFEVSAGQDLAERLLRALESGRDAGGQPEGLNSAALVVCDRHPFPIVDLRVDLNDKPVEELRRVWDFYRPMIPYYTARRHSDPTVGDAALPWWKYRAKAVPGWVPRHLQK